MLVFKIAFRNIFRNKRRSIFTSITMIISFILAALTMSIQDGSYDSIIDNFTKSSTGDIQIHAKDFLDSPSIYKTIKENLGIEHLLKKKVKIKSISPQIKGSALAFTNSTPIPITITGEDSLFSNKKTAQNENQIIINKNMAKKLNVKIGEKIYLISQGADGSPANDVFKVIAVTDKNNSKLEQHAFISLKTAQEFFSLYGQVHEYKITINSFKDAIPTAAQINKILRGDKKYDEISAAPWQVIQKEFYKAMQGDKEGGAVLLFIVVLIVAIGVLNTVLMSILERKREFGVLKAIGTRGNFIFKMIVLESIIISILSILIASILFALINIYFVNTGIQLGEAAVSVGDFKMSTINGTYSIKEFLLPGLTILLSSIIVSLYPAFKESKSKAIDSLKAY